MSGLGVSAGLFCRQRRRDLKTLVDVACTTTRLRHNITVSGWTIPAEYKAVLDEVSYLPDRYPDKLEKHMQKRRDHALGMPSLE